MVHNVERQKPATATGIGLKRKMKPHPPTSQSVDIKLLENQATGTMSPLKVKKNRKKKAKGLTATEVTHNELSDRFPILKNSDLVNKFLSVPMSNNQKGRIRQVLKDSLRGTSDVIMPEVIHTKILNILKSANDLTDTELRKIRILYNMLKTASAEQEAKTTKREAKPLNQSLANSKQTDKKASEDKNKSTEKVKGPRRHVVFVGNLPFDITREKLMEHFSDISKDIVDIRIPKPEDEKKSAIAYIEIKDDHNYELALSKHHTMLGTRRINVLYTTQANSKFTMAEVKSKTAKMIALQKQGKLLGSVPLIRKRSQRRKKMKIAQSKEAIANEAKHLAPGSTEKAKFW